MIAENRKLGRLAKGARRGFILSMIASTGIYRTSFKSDKARNTFKKEALAIIEQMLLNVDDGSLTNYKIRKAIIRIMDACGCSCGLAQKALNVALKYYCFVKGTPLRVIKELDCPIDSNVVAEYYKKGKYDSRYRLLNLSMKNYEFLQNKIQNDEGLRILGELAYNEG